MKTSVLVIYVLFISYYLFVMHVLRRLGDNPCGCEKLEGYKRTWNFKYAMIATPALLITNIFFMYKTLFSRQVGGGMVRAIQNMLLLGFAVTFVNDFALISLFRRMAKENCPCNEDNRTRLLNTTYAKLIFNSVFLYAALSVATPRHIRNLIRKAKRASK